MTSNPTARPPVTDRFFVPQPLSTELLVVAGAEAHHMTTVLRLKPGCQVELFDGQGGHALAEIIAVDRRSVTLQPSSVQTKPAPEPPVILATAVPKGERFRWLVEKTTEIGVDRLVPLQTERSVVTPGVGKLEKVAQTVIAACKQSGRNWLMEVDAPIPLAEFLERECKGSDLWLADAHGGPPLRSSAEPVSKRPIVLIVGPEGGLTPEEGQAARRAGALPIKLGPHVLRIETACLAIAALAVWQRE